MGVFQILAILYGSTPSSNAKHLALIQQTCPGAIEVKGKGLVHIIPTGWKTGDDYAKVNVSGRTRLTTELYSRGYFAKGCYPGIYSNHHYTAWNLLGHRLKWTVDLSGAGCGCNSAFYLTNMAQNPRPSECFDHYCDANNVCGESCAEIDLMEANQFSWHSTLHTKHDHSGLGVGYGGGDGWNGPRDWLHWQYKPGGSQIDTDLPFHVEIEFPVDRDGILHAMEVKLWQGIKKPLKTRVTQYDGMADLTEALKMGMTPIISYWSSDAMLWMDGDGPDQKGPCHRDYPEKCADSVSMYDFEVEKLDYQVDAVSQGSGKIDGMNALTQMSKTNGNWTHTCPGKVKIEGYGEAYLVPGGIDRSLDRYIEGYHDERGVVSMMRSRAYLASDCVPGKYNNKDYLALNLLGKSLSYTIDLSGSTCGCNAALSLTGMRWNSKSGDCRDYSCDASGSCGASCAEIDIQNANEKAWLSVLHAEWDHSGLAGGYGGRQGNNGPRDWTSDDYGPGGRVIDTTKSFNVTASFPMDKHGYLVQMAVTLSQEGKTLTTELSNYMGDSELTHVLKKGLTPVISYWKWDRMFWLDGPGADGKGPCKKDTPELCAQSVRFSNFAIQTLPKISRKRLSTKVEAGKGTGQCYEGWEPPENCAKDFTYRGENYIGCTTARYKGRGWCSIDRNYSKKWTDCRHCAMEFEDTTFDDKSSGDDAPEPAEFLKLHDQCGGNGWTKTCGSGLFCERKNPWYAQCKEGGAECIDGWQRADGCTDNEFFYNDNQYRGCVESFGHQDWPRWCSANARYSGRRHNCSECEVSVTVARKWLRPAEDEGSLIEGQHWTTRWSLTTTASGVAFILMGVIVGLVSKRRASRHSIARSTLADAQVEAQPLNPSSI